MRHPYRSCAAASLLVVTLLAGCSSSGGSDADAPSRTTTTAAAKGPTTTAATSETTTTTGDDGETTTTGGGGDDAICKPLKAISDYDLETAAALKEQAPWSEVQATYIKDTDNVLSAYDDAAALADPSVAADIKTLRDFTAPTSDLARKATSLVDLGLALADQDGLLEAGQAGLRLDTFARQTCGFGTSAAGN